MAWLFADDDKTPGRKPYGFLRYRQVLERDFFRFFRIDLVCLLGFVPFAVGVGYGVLSSSILVLLPAGFIGGMILGPFLSCMTDCILRSLRDHRGDLWVCFRRAWRQNWRSSLLPGGIFGLFLALEIFMGMLFYWSSAAPSPGTLALWFASMVLGMMVFSVYWPQLVLFEQKGLLRLKNCLLFALMHFWRLLFTAVLQVVWWLIGVLLVPWSAYLVPFFGIWVILLISQFLLYDAMDRAFRIEEQIFEAFPEQGMD